MSRVVNNGVVTDDAGNMQYFTAEVITRDGHGTTHAHKVITLHELEFIPLESRKDPDLLGKMHTVLRGCYDAEIDILHIIAGLYDTDPPLGIMQFYGVMGTGTSQDEALQQALLGSAGLIHTMANFPQIAFKPLDIYRTQWLRDAMFAMPYALTVIGQPDPRNAARGGGRATMPGTGDISGAADGEITSQQNEMLMRAMADARQSFMMMTMASRVQRSALATLLEGVARRASLVASQQRGTRGISFNLGIPIILSGLTGQAAAVTHGTAVAHGTSDAIGTASGQAHTTSHNTFSADSQSRGSAYTQGSAVSHGNFASSSTGIAVSDGTSAGSAHTAGSSWGTSHVTGVADTTGTAHAVGGAHTVGTADTTSVAHSAGHSTSVSHSNGTTVVQSSGTSVSSGTAQTASSGTNSGTSIAHSASQGVTTSSGQSTSISSGQSASIRPRSSLNVSTQHMDAEQNSAGVSANVGGSAGVNGGIGVAGVDARVNSSVGANASWGHSASDTGGVSQGHSSAVTTGTSQGVTAGTSTSHGTTTNSGTTTASSVGASSGQASTTSSGTGASTGTSVASSSSTTVSHGSFASTTRGQAHTNSEANTSSWANSTSQAHSDSSASGHSRGGSVADTSSQSSSHGVTLVSSHSAGSSSSVTQSTATTRSQSISHSEGSGSGAADTTSSSRSRMHGVAETTGISRGQSLGSTTSTGIMAGISPGVSVNKSFAFEDDVMGQLTEVFRQQEELARQMSLEGGYITDVYMLCKTPAGLKVAETAVPQAFHGMTEVVTPVQTRKLDPAEQQHIRQHIAAWTPCATEERILDGVNAYRHGTLLTIGQLAAYTAPGLFEEGTAATTMEQVPPLGFYPDIQGDVVLGHQISPETRKVTNVKLRLSEGRMFHTLFAADTGFGKSVAAARLALETTQQWHYRTIVLDFGAGWRDMIHAPGLPPERLTLWQLYPGSPRPLRWNPLQIGRRIDPDQQFRVTPELLANAGRMGPKQLGFMQETLSGLYRDTGVLTTDGRVQAHQYWGHVQDGAEEAALNARHRERGQSEERLRGRPLHLLSADELQALAIHRSKRVDIMDWYGRLLALEKVLKGRPADLTSLEGVKVRLKPFTYGNMARMYRKGDDTIAIEDVALPWGMCVFEGGAQLDTYAKTALLSLMAWHLYIDAVARERQGAFYRMQVFFEEANKVLTGIDGPENAGSSTASVSQQFEDMWRDGRKYGIFLHPIVQTPSDLPPGIVSSCNNVIFGQLKNPRDRDLAVAHLGFSEKGFTDEDYRRWITRIEIGRAAVRLGYTPEYGEMMPLYAAMLKVPTRPASEADIARFFARGDAAE